MTIFHHLALHRLAGIHTQVFRPLHPAKHLHAMLPARISDLKDFCPAEHLHAARRMPAVIVAMHGHADAWIALHGFEFGRTRVRQHVDIQTIGPVFDGAGNGLAIDMIGGQHTHIGGAQQLLHAIFQFFARQSLGRPGRLYPGIGGTHSPVSKGVMISGSAAANVLFLVPGSSSTATSMRARSSRLRKPNALRSSDR